MVSVTPAYKFDLLEVPTDLDVHVTSLVFPAHKIVLINQSDYFRKLLTGNFEERYSKKVILKDLDPQIFELVFKTMYGTPIRMTDLETIMHYLVLVDFFQVKGIDIKKLEKEIYVAPEEFGMFVAYIDRIHHGEIDPDLLASKVEPGTDLNFLSPEMQEAIKISPKLRYHGRNDDFIQQLYKLARQGMHGPLKYYENSREGLMTQAHSLAEALLNFRQYDYRFYLSQNLKYVNDISTYDPKLAVIGRFDPNFISSFPGLPGILPEYSGIIYEPYSFSFKELQDRFEDIALEYYDDNQDINAYLEKVSRDIEEHEFDLI